MGIISLFSLGVALSFYQFFRLLQEERRFLFLKRKNFPREGVLIPLTELSEMAPYLSTQHVTTALERIREHLQEGRTFVRYAVNLLVFLGLLGTFWGLSQTITLIADAITNMPRQGVGEAGAIDVLTNQLQKPLAGMGVAFGSSLFGLGGSLVLGFVDLQVGRAQAQFLRYVESWAIQAFSASQGGETPSFSTARFAESVDQFSRGCDALRQREDKLTEAFPFQKLLAVIEEQQSVLDAWKDEQLKTRHLLENMLAQLHNKEKREHSLAIEELRELTKAFVADGKAGRRELAGFLQQELRTLGHILSRTPS